jgi:TP901 family phage tail tape measure protein
MVANLFLKFGADTEEYQKKMRAAVTRMLFAAESLTQAGRILSTAVTAPMLAVGAASLKTAMQFESAMTRMESLVGIPAETLARWKPVVQDMAGTVGKSANELAEALFFVTSNGFQTDEALKVLEATAKASAVGMGETKDIAIAATSALNAYGQGAMTANESVAVLIGTVREGNLEAAELPSALSRLLPVAAAMGIEFHEAGAGIAAMSRSGTSARLAAFGMRAIMIGLQAPTKAAAAALKKVHLSSDQIQKTIRADGLLAALLQMKDAMKGTNVTLKDLFPNQRAYVAALQLLGENVEDNIEIFKNMSDVVGDDVDDAFNKGAKTMERTFNKAMGDLSSAAIDLGNNMVPLIDNFGKLASKASDTARAYNELDDYWKGLIDSAAISAVAIGPVLYALGSLARIMARFTGLSILFKLAWVKNAASMMESNAAAIKLTKSGTALGASWGQLAGLAVTTGIAAYQFGKWLDHHFEITKALNEEFGRLGKSYQSIGEVLDKDEDRMIAMSGAARNLAMKIGELGLANELTAAQQAGNGREVARLTEAINEKASAFNSARIKVEGLTKAEEDHKNKQDAIAEAARELAEEEEARLKKLRETHGLMTSDEVTAKMAEMSGYYKDHLDAGVKQELVNARFKDDWLELVELAKTYGIATTDSFKAMGESMRDQGLIENSEFYKLFDYYIPQAINAIPGKVIEGMVTINDGVATSLKGGLDKGFAEGLTAYTTQMKPQFEAALTATYKQGFSGFGDELRDQINAAVDRLQPIKLPIVPDPDVFNNAMNDLLDGQYPDTRG